MTACELHAQAVAALAERLPEGLRQLFLLATLGTVEADALGFSPAEVRSRCCLLRLWLDAEEIGALRVQREVDILVGVMDTTGSIREGMGQRGREAPYRAQPPAVVDRETILACMRMIDRVTRSGEGVG